MEIEEIKTAVDAAVNPVMSAFEEFKAANDARLAEIEKKGSADPILDEKLANIEKTLSNFESMNQKLTLAEKKAAAASEAVDKMEVALARIPSTKSVSPSEQRAKVESWVRAAIRASTVGVHNMSADEIKSLDDVRNEYKSLYVSSDVAGGYLAPMEYVREIIKAVTEVSVMRPLVNVRQTMMKSIQMPRRTGTFSATWVAEQGTKAETTGLAYGLHEIPTHEMYALVDISNQMLEDAAFNMESEIRMESTEQFAVAEGTAIVSGNSIGKPEGFLTNADVSYTNSGAATAVTADGLMSLFYAIKTAYAANGTFLLNRGSLAAVRKLKDGEGQYLWMPGLANGIPNTILGAPYVEVPDMPDISAGTYPIAFGDWRRAYVLVDRLAMEFLRDPYTQATSGNVRFIMRKRVGGQVVLAEAIRKLYISA